MDTPTHAAPEASPERATPEPARQTPATPRPIVTPAIIVVNIAIFAAMVARGASILNPGADTLLQWGANYGPKTAHGEWWRLLSAAFLHFGAMHLLSNMIALWGVGLTAERLCGRAGLLTIYLTTALTASVASVLAHPMVVSAGASGAVFGVYGGLCGLLLFLRHSLQRDMVQSLLKSTIIVVGANLAYGLGQPEIDLTAHVAGFLAGLPAGAALALPWSPQLQARRLQRIALVAIVAIGLVTFAASRIPKFDDWLGETRRFSVIQTETTATYNDALRQLRTNAITADQFARIVDTQVIPPWTAERRTVEQLSLPEPQQTQARHFVDYLALTVDAWRMTADGLTRNDLETLAGADAKDEAALTALMEVVADKRAIAAQLAAMRTEHAAIQARRAAAETFRAALAKVDASERESVSAINAALARAGGGKATGGAVDDVLQQVLARWNHERDVLAAIPAPSEQTATKEKVLQYMALRAEGWSLMGRGLRTNDAGLLAEARAKQDEAFTLGRTFGSAERARR
jgi:rhomboid protease GluP